MSVGLLFRRLRYGYNARLIPVGQGRYAIVDADDYERLAKYKWHVRSDGNTHYAFRWSSTRGGKKRHRVLMHREVIDIPEGLVCDHINRNGLHNRKANVRLATSSQNSCNSRKRAKASSRYRGVTWNARLNKWIARIRANGRQTHLGAFDDEVDAAKAYDTAAKKYHGEFAVLNFPDRTPSPIIVWICWFFAKMGERWVDRKIRRPGHQGITRQGIRGPGDQVNGGSRGRGSGDQEIRLTGDHDITGSGKLRIF